MRAFQSYLIFLFLCFIQIAHTELNQCMNKPPIVLFSDTDSDHVTAKAMDAMGFQIEFTKVGTPETLAFLVEARDLENVRPFCVPYMVNQISPSNYNFIVIPCIESCSPDCIDPQGTVTYTLTPITMDGCQGNTLYLSLTVYCSCQSLTSCASRPAALRPSHFCGKVKKAKCKGGYEIIHKLTWKPSVDPTIDHYEISAVFSECSR